MNLYQRLMPALLIFLGFQVLVLAQVGGPSMGSSSSDAQSRLIVQLGHSSFVRAIAFSPDGQNVLTGSADKTARLWDTKTGKELRKFEGHTSDVRSVAFSPDGKYVLTGSEDKTARLWEVETGREVRKFEGHSHFIRSAVFSADGKYILTGSWDKSARLWETATARLVQTFAGDSDRVMSATLSADRKYVLTGSIDGIARLWETESGRLVRRFEKHSWWVSSVAFHPNGKYVLTAGWDDTVRLWETDTGREVRQFNGHTNIVNSAVFSPNGKYVLTGSDDDTARVWETDTGREVRKVESRPSSVYSATFSPDGKQVIIGCNKNATLWEINSGGQVQLFGGHSAMMFALACLTDGKYLLTGDGEGTARLWGTEVGGEVRRVELREGLIWSLAFSADGRYALAGEGRVARMWEVQTGREVRRFEGHNSLVESVAFSTDQRYVLTAGSLDQTARLWDAETGKELRQFVGHSALVHSAVFSPDGRHVLTASNDATARVWETETGREVRRLELHSIYVGPAVFSADGEYILTSGGIDRTVRLWETKTGREVRQFKGHTEWVKFVAFSADGKYVLTGSLDGTARLWQTASGKEVRVFDASAGPISAMALSPDGKYVMTALQDSTLRVWDISSGKELCRLISFEDGTWAVVTPDGRFDTNNLEEIRGLHWLANDEPMRALPVEVLMRDYYEPRLLARLLNGEMFPPLPPVTELNRVQPNIEKITVLPQRHHEEMVTVKVRVASTLGQCLNGRKHVVCESGIYDLRLYRDGQLVGQAGAHQDGRSHPNVVGQSWRDQIAEWRQNNALESMNRRPVTAAMGPQEITFANIRLPRRSDISHVDFTAYAFNADRVKSETYHETYKLPKPLKPVKGKAYLITIGVAASEDPRWNLFYPANDARGLQRELYDRLSKQYDQVVRVPLVSDYGAVTKKAGDCDEKKPIRKAILTVVDLLAGRHIESERKQLVPCADQIEKANPEDLVLVSFSGHGYGDRRGNYYLFPYDTGTMNQDQQITNGLPEELLDRLISSEEMATWMRDIDAGEFIMILDACQSEAATGREFKPGPMGSRGLGQLAYDKGMRMIVATQADNQAVGSGSLSHGLLTYALLEGLESDKGRVLNVKQWLEGAQQRVPGLYEEKVADEVKKQGKPQLPSVFDFARNKELLLFGKSN